MQPSEIKSRLSIFPFEKGLIGHLSDNFNVVDQAVGEVALKQGDPVNRIPLYLIGESKLCRYSAAKDKQYVICHVKPGETCPTSLVAALTKQTSAVTGIAIKPVKKLLIPIYEVQYLQDHYDSWNRFVLKSMTKGYNQILSSFSGAMTKTVEQRIQDFLHLECNPAEGHKIKITHEELAEEIGSSRVVVTRTLKKLEDAGVVVLHRGKISLRIGAGAIDDIVEPIKAKATSFTPLRIET